jgi:beta-1,4-mannosyl-glycoprotein beta-1,4-N-acetylglucosaminyltransferase
MKKIFDCFLFYNEVELLELRLMELYDTVDYFVIVEANKTFKNNPKPYYFDINKNMYKDYSDKIIHLKYDNPPSSSQQNIWQTEYSQRNFIMEGLKNVAKVGDKIILSDVDEIINSDVIQETKNTNGMLALEQKLFYYYVNCKSRNNWQGPCIADYGSFSVIQQLRKFGRGNAQVVKDAGWHYTYMGGLERVVTKLNNTSDGHLALSKIKDEKDIENKINNNLNLWGDSNAIYDVVDIEGNAPKSINKFLEKYPHFLLKK